MLILPKPECFTEEEWTVKETEAMNEVRTLYGKTYHLWQVDRGDKYPFGEPELMMSITDREQMDFDKLVGARDKKFGIDYRNKEKAREHLEDFKIDPGKLEAGKVGDAGLC